MPINKETQEVSDAVVVETKKQMKDLGAALVAGLISLAAFEVAMRELIKASHTLLAGIGAGGKDQMTLSRWGKVGNAIKAQYQYLNGFERAIKNGKVSEAQIINRAGLYAASARKTFYAVVVDSAVSDTTANDPVTGDSITGDPMARRVLNANESCDGCIAESSDDYVPLSELAEIGSQECGDYCLCTIEFENE